MFFKIPALAATAALATTNSRTSSSSSSISTSNNIGFSLSPGGLLYPYHIGALDGLKDNNYLLDSTPIAGASAGAIAVASYAANVPSETCLETTIRICDECTKLGGARGQLMNLLNNELQALLSDDAHQVINNRNGMVALAYYELFPNTGPILQTYFTTRDELIETILNSSMFPFFTSNLPFRILKNNNNNNIKKNRNDSNIVNRLLSSVQDKISSLPRVVVDGYFAVPLNRFGCPDFNLAFNSKNSIALGGTAAATTMNSEAYIDRMLKIEDQMEDQLANNFERKENEFAHATDNTDDETDGNNNIESASQSQIHHPKHTYKHIDRTITISVFPHDSVLLTASQKHDRISPLYDENNPIGQVSELLRLATQPLKKEEVHMLYENGYRDVERWIMEENQRKYMIKESSDIFSI